MVFDDYLSVIIYPYVKYKHPKADIEVFNSISDAVSYILSNIRDKIFISNHFVSGGNEIKRQILDTYEDYRCLL
jgi:hypothetical protein